MHTSTSTTNSTVADPYCNQHRAAERLYAEYTKYGNLIIGVDFDDTIYDCHANDYVFPATIDVLKEAQALGCKLCVWTANADKALVHSVWADLGLTINHYNESPIKFHDDQVKPYFNLLLDDRAGLGDAMYSLIMAIHFIKRDKRIKAAQHV